MSDVDVATAEQRQKRFNFPRAEKQARLRKLPLEKTERALLLNLEHHIGENINCWPSLSRIGDYIGKSERQVRRVIRRLEQLGLVVVVKTFSGPKLLQSTNRFWIDWDAVAAMEAGVTNGSASPDISARTFGSARADILERKGGHQMSAETIPEPNTNKHQNPARCGVFESGTNGTKPAASAQSQSATETVFGSPLQIDPVQLDSADRVDELWRLAVSTGASHDNDLARLRFFALACYCRSNPAVNNPGAAFAANILHGRWFGSDDHEARAKRAIARLDARRGIVGGPAAAGAQAKALFAMPEDALANVAPDT